MGTRIINAEYRPATAEDLREIIRQCENPLPIDVTEWGRDAIESDLAAAREALAALERGEPVFIAYDDDGPWVTVGYNPTGFVARLREAEEDEERDLAIRSAVEQCISDALAVYGYDDMQRFLREHVTGYGRHDSDNEPQWDDNAATEALLDLWRAAYAVADALGYPGAEIHLYETGFQVVSL